MWPTTASRTRRRAPTRSEVGTTGEVIGDARPRQLVHGEPVAPRRLERGAGSLRDLEGSWPFPARSLQAFDRPAEIGDAVHEDRPVALEVVGQQDRRRTRRKLDRRNARPAV